MHTHTVTAAQAATIRHFKSIAKEVGNTIDVYANPSGVSMVENFPEGFSMVWLVSDDGTAELE